MTNGGHGLVTTRLTPSFLYPSSITHLLPSLNEAERLQNAETFNRFGLMAFNDLCFVNPVISEPWVNERHDTDLPYVKKKTKGNAPCRRLG